MLLFPPFRLDPARGLLYRNHERVALSRKSAAVLAELVARAGEAVPKAELLAAVWPDTHVVEANLKVHVLEIRRALGDDMRRPRFIETLHRRGYRFIASVDTDERDRTSAALRPALVPTLAGS